MTQASSSRMIDGLTTVLKPRTIFQSPRQESRSGDSIPTDSATIFCSYSDNTNELHKELKQIRENRNISKLQVENLLLSPDKEQIFAMEDFIMQTTTAMPVVPEEETLHQTVDRDWTEINFVDDISSRGRYLEYAAEKTRLMKSLKRYHRMIKQSRLDLPLTFRVRVQLRPTMDIFAIIQLFQEITRDPMVKEVEFPHCVQKVITAEPDKATNVFASFIDESTLQWSGPAMALHISYKDDTFQSAHREQEFMRVSSNRETLRKNQLGRGRSKYNSSSAAFLKECTAKLEKMILMQFRPCGQQQESIGSLSVLSSTNSCCANIDFGISIGSY
jgi:hypothetical protein